jgi:hypothetical protein
MSNIWPYCCAVRAGWFCHRRPPEPPVMPRLTQAQMQQNGDTVQAIHTTLDRIPALVLAPTVRRVQRPGGAHGAGERPVNHHVGMWIHETSGRRRHREQRAGSIILLHDNPAARADGGCIAAICRPQGACLRRSPCARWRTATSWRFVLGSCTCEVGLRLHFAADLPPRQGSAWSGCPSALDRLAQRAQVRCGEYGTLW